MIGCPQEEAGASREVKKPQLHLHPHRVLRSLSSTGRALAKCWRTGVRVPERPLGYCLKCRFILLGCSSRLLDKCPSGLWKRSRKPPKRELPQVRILPYPRVPAVRLELNNHKLRTVTLRSPASSRASFYIKTFKTSPRKRVLRCPRKSSCSWITTAS